MRRSRLRIALLATTWMGAAAPLAAQQPPIVNNGRLGRPPAGAERATVEHTFQALAGQRIEVELRSTDFDAFLELIPPASETFYRNPIRNDDFGGGTDARVTAVASTEGTWRAVVSAYDQKEGAYELGIVLGGVGRLREVAQRTLGEADSVSAKGRRYAAFQVVLDQEADLLLEMSSEAFEPVLVVESPNGVRYSSADGSSGLNARVDVSTAEAGIWRVVAAQAVADEPLGAYSVRLIELPLEAGEAITGALAEGDPRDIDGEFYEEHRIEGTAAGPLVLTLRSNDFDAYLAARSPTGQWYRDDDGGGETHARLELPPLAGTWHVIVTSYGAGESGRYRLLIARDPR